MRHSPEKRNPGWRAGAGKYAAGAAKTPCPSDNLSTLQAQRLIADHALQPNIAALIAPLAFGETRNV